jgi:Flp pilus assembly protein TadD
MKPKFGPAMSSKGLALENLGRNDAARAAYRDAADTGDTLARFRLAYLDEVKGQSRVSVQSHH